MRYSWITLNFHGRAPAVTSGDWVEPDTATVEKFRQLRKAARDLVKAARDPVQIQMYSPYRVGSGCPRCLKVHQHNHADEKSQKQEL
ncbi:hypothetical protein U1Q18_042174 [Sarracenia purpurea var. burkii]